MERAVNAARGTLLGLACGDALGRPVEFSTSAGIEREHGTLTKMAGDGTHGQPAGTITDDTELALRIGRSLADRSEFDGGDIARRFVEWYRSGPFDIGLMTADALRAIDDGMSWREAGQVVWESRSEGSNAGNGSLMRCAPYAIRYARSPIELDAVSHSSSAITHADPRCTHACSVLNRILATLMLVDEETARKLPFDPLIGVVENPLFGLPDDIEAALRPGLDGLSPDDLDNSGYVVSTLQAGLYYGLTANSAEEAIVTAVNAGGDTDTIGAVAGAVAGARFGMSTLPERWLTELDKVNELDRVAQNLYGQREASTTWNDDTDDPSTEPIGAIDLFVTTTRTADSGPYRTSAV
ncbi:ADP-ribosylglycohydrolase family protein [Natranaeroarchaeum sulfidigenes]|uniref:ADP-ribosylglycohydrolase n=1 Tax=Natranaeroarchaeum sulfidigenes TaxID=2784880 RepID=A0A897MSC9_9EURY|nr:ADP-ribosylglycohydrolase family protein [Natranaeroarchaeum sulfidigenes]QSG02938.1 ADP-ribosylglycohydrolase [Natranaeroarchaeum sulfidigenes]